MDDLSARLCGDFRRVKPFSLVAILADGSEKKVALRSGRGRWEHAAGVVAPWVADGARIECRDKAGAVLALLEYEAEAETDAPRAPMSTGADARWMLDLMLRAQDQALKRHHEMLGTLLDANNGMIELLGARISTLEASYGRMLQAQLDATMARAEAEAAAASKADDSQLAGLAAHVLGAALPNVKTP